MTKKSYPSHVVVLHGWGLSGFVTKYWCRRLHMAGFAASAFSYRSLTRSLDHNVGKLAAHIQALPTTEPVHLVGHSLGGIMIMQCLANHRFTNLGRVVMVGTPFQGSAPAQKLKATRLGRFLLGKTIVQWDGVHAKDMPKGLEVGTIAGTSPLGMGRLLGGLDDPHDGTVSVKETEVSFAVDRVVMPVTHSEMLVSGAVAAQIVRFLQTGKFKSL
jgi:pimeloyl-ACP methyl ester carboxylesterase